LSAARQVAVAFLLRLLKRSKDHKPLTPFRRAAVLENGVRNRLPMPSSQRGRARQESAPRAGMALQGRKPGEARENVVDEPQV